MDPCPRGNARRRRGLPRTRGDGPHCVREIRARERASPHTRGWTRSLSDPGPARSGFPAHAGMDLDTPTGRCGARRLPRTRGDGPAESGSGSRPASASPHTRGWTLIGRVGRQRALGFPAHAGMDHRFWRGGTPRTRLPRTRGDGPGGPVRPPHRGSGFPAHAGMDRTPGMASIVSLRLPRTRGDGPGGPVRPPHRGSGFPAHAGMDRTPGMASIVSLRLPRTRGDGPLPPMPT